MKKFTEMVADCLPDINEEFPWDIEEKLNSDTPPLLVDICEPREFNAMHIKGALHVPRGVLESACEYGYEETISELAAAREREIVVICRSGNRSAMAAFTMQLMGYSKVSSMKTGLRGWNDAELPLEDKTGQAVPIDIADEFFSVKLRPDQEIPAA